MDGVARILAQELGEQTGGTFVVENRAGGAGGAVGSAAVMRSRPDGATLLLNASIHVVVPLINRNVAFDVVNDFTHISLVADGPLIVTTHPPCRRGPSASSSPWPRRSRSASTSPPPASARPGTSASSS